MKTGLIDFILSIIVVSVILLITILIESFITPLIFPVFGSFSILPIIVSFVLIYGFSTAIYLKVLNAVFPMKTGDYSMEDSQFTLWKHHMVVSEFGKLALKPFFPIFMRPIFYKIWGASIGKYVSIGGIIAEPQLVTIEDGGVLGHGTVVTCHIIVSNEFHLRKVKIGRNATIGINVILMPGVDIGEKAVVAAGAVVTPETRIPSKELWGGIPAKKIKDIID